MAYRKLGHGYALPICPNSSFIPRCLFCFPWSLNSVSYYCICIVSCATL